MTRVPFKTLAATVLTGAVAAVALGQAREDAATPHAARPPDAAPTWEWRLPPGFPVPRVPADNPMSTAKVALGRRLFYDRQLSGNGAQACASCHRQALAFTDAHPRAEGSTGETHRRSAMSLANVAYATSYTWADPRTRTLETQMLVPMFGTDPIELGMKGHEVEILERLAAEPLYPPLFADAFPNDATPIRFDNVVRAIAAFERTLLSGDSPYDRLVYGGDSKALGDAAKRGMRLFFSDRLACARCHAGPTFSGPIDFEGAEALKPPPAPRFHNTGLYNLDGRGAYPAADTGLHDVTGRRRDMGKFKAPTLRNIALTAPYMHDGSITTLREVVAHYAKGGRAGGESRAKDPLIAGFILTGTETDDLIAFLEALTDEAFVGDTRYSDPWAE